jgi:hypothetical protein
MANATSISLKQFSQSVQSAVKAAAAQHPKFKLNVPNTISVSYLIRGIPVPEALLKNVTIDEVQSFANDVAKNISVAHSALFAAGQAEGAVISIGRRIIIGIPPVSQFEIGE